MWSLGCITVVLLTGGSPFVNQRTNQYCQKLAQQCDLQQLDHCAEWQFVGKRPKDFVRRLLVLDESQRMSAKDAKDHWWFSNDFHRLDFEELYHRATKHWKPSTLKDPVIELIDAEQLVALPVLQKYNPLGQRNNRRRSLTPIDPPYKPYSRRMSLSLLPKRRSSLFGTMSDEVKTAIQENWSPENMRAKASDSENVEATVLNPDTGANELDRARDSQAGPGAAKGRVAHRANPSSISSLQRLVERQPGMVPERILLTDRASEVPMLKESASQTIPRASHPQTPCTIRITGLDPGRSGQREGSKALKRYPWESEGLSPTTEAASIEERGPRAVDDVTSSDGIVDLTEGKEDLATEVSSNLPVHRSIDQFNERAGEEALRVNICRSIPPRPACSSPKDSIFQDSIDARLLDQADPKTPDRKSAPSKLQMPSRKRLSLTSKRPSTIKRRRLSIYDLDSDDESNQAHCRLSRLTLDSNSTTCRASAFRKKAKMEINGEIG